MMQYSRNGIYIKRKKKAKQSSLQNKEGNVDWINVFLFGLLVIVMVLFIFT